MLRKGFHRQNNRIFREICANVSLQTTFSHSNHVKTSELFDKLSSVYYLISVKIRIHSHSSQSISFQSPVQFGNFLNKNLLNSFDMHFNAIHIFRSVTFFIDTNCCRAHKLIEKYLP